MTSPDETTPSGELPPLEIVVALAENGVIGRDGDLPWHLPGDLRHFKQLTSGHVLLMGRKTWESLGGRPLPKRRHLVLSRDPSFPAAVDDVDAVEVFGDLHSALDRGAELIRRAERAEKAEYGDDARRLFVIGGEAVFRAALPLARDLHLTRVHAEPEGDVCFPALDLRHFRKLEQERHPADERHEHAFTIEHWRREEEVDEEAAGYEPLTCDTVGWSPFRALLEDHGLELRVVPEGRPIPATYWGEPEAGLRGDVVYARSDTPVHSLLHEACHALLAGAERRRDLDVDAESDQAEEDAVCLLQVLLADRLPGVGRGRLVRDMDAWGYRFLAGSTEDFVRQGSDAAREFLRERGLLPERLLPDM